MHPPFAMSPAGVVTTPPADGLRGAELHRRGRLAEETVRRLSGTQPVGDDQLAFAHAYFEVCLYQALGVIERAMRNHPDDPAAAAIAAASANTTRILAHFHARGNEPLVDFFESLEGLILQAVTEALAERSASPDEAVATVFTRLFGFSDTAWPRTVELMQAACSDCHGEGVLYATGQGFPMTCPSCGGRQPSPPIAIS